MTSVSSISPAIEETHIHRDSPTYRECRQHLRCRRLGPPEQRRQQSYNENWTCPIPPKENRLTVRIKAGEKRYKDELE